MQQGGANCLSDLQTTYLSHILWPRLSRLIQPMQALGRVLEGKNDSVFPRVPLFPGDRAGLAALAGHHITSESWGLHGRCSLCPHQPSRGTSAAYRLLLSTAFPGVQHLCLPCGLGPARAARAARLHCTCRCTAHVGLVLCTCVRTNIQERKINHRWRKINHTSRNRQGEKEQTG